MSPETQSYDIRKIGEVYIFGALSDNKTEEQKAFEKFIKIFQNIPSIGYYKPPLKDYLNQKEPDGLWFNPNIGIVVFEIKLWDKDFLSDKFFDNRERLVDVFGNEHNINPYRQSDDYRKLIINKIKNVKPLPVANIVYFPNIKENDVKDLHPTIKSLIENNKDITLFGGTHISDALKKIQERLKVNIFASMEKFQDRYELTTITEQQYNQLKSLLFPIVQVPKKELDTFDTSNIPVLDFHQEGILYKVRPTKKPQNGELHSDKVLRGTAGTGKSVVIQAKGLFEKVMSPDKKILFVSYTNSLVNEARNNIKALIDRENIPVDINNIDFYTVDSLITQIYLKIASEIIYEEGNTVSEKALDYVYEYIKSGKQIPEEYKYDVILVDESQDLTKKHIQIIHSLKKDEYIAIWGVDETQRIYGTDKENDTRNWNWQSVGVQARGNTIILKRTYRNPGAIVRFARKFLSLDEKLVEKLKELNLSDEEIQIMREDNQSIEFLETGDKHIKFVLEGKVRDLLKQGYQFKDIMILLPDSKLINMVGSHFVSVFGKENVNYFSSESSKSEKEVHKDKLNILTYHSSKGLENKVVIVSSINYYPHLNSKYVEEIRTERRLLYVAMTRPLEKLILVYDNYLDNKRKEILDKNPKSVNGLSFGEEIKNLYKEIF